MLGVLLRPSGVATLVRRKGGGSDRANFLRAVVTAAYPFVIAAVIFLLVLRSLSYRVAARYFLERFLISAAWIAGAMLLRRWFLRVLLGGEPKVAMPPAEWATDAPRYEAQGRRALFDRLRRLALTLVAFGPALFFVLDAWGLTGAGWDAVFNRPIALLSNLTLGNVVSATLTAVLAFFLVRSTRDFLRFVILPRTSLDLGVRYTIVTLTTYILVAGSAVVILGGQLKVSPAVIGGFVAALGLGLGFGLQEIINNFFSGIILLVERPLKVGDTVSISGTTGRVDRINMRSTTIMTAENTGVIVPNKDLISSTVTNWSAGTPMIREAVALGIAYGSDTAEFKKVVLEVVESHGLVLKHPAPEIIFINFGASSLDFSLRYWIRLGTSGSKVKSDLFFALDAAFRRHGIEMPYPTQDIHVRTWERKEGGAPPPSLPRRSAPRRRANAPPKGRSDAASDDERFMRQALAEAGNAAESADVPIGCVIVRDGRIIGQGVQPARAPAGPDRARRDSRDHGRRVGGRELAARAVHPVRDAGALPDVRGRDRPRAAPAPRVRGLRSEGRGLRFADESRPRPAAQSQGRHHPGHPGRRVRREAALFLPGASPVESRLVLAPGEVPEWSNGPVSKTGVPAMVPRVRIPTSPLEDG